MNKLDSPRENQSRIRTQQGFTLIELVITMVIAAILAAIAIPSYSAYIQKSRRTEAKSALLDLASLEERYFSTNNTYTNQAGNLGYPAGTATPFAVGSSYYNITSITVTAAVAPTGPTSVGAPASYLITATPVAGTTQANDSACQTFTISSTGQRTATGTDPNASTDCWQ
jgi:type IV pilus assembly protein PilE